MYKLSFTSPEHNDTLGKCTTFVGPCISQLEKQEARMKGLRTKREVGLSFLSGRTGIGTKVSHLSVFEACSLEKL
jgi:hypothetical protein